MKKVSENLKIGFCSILLATSCLLGLSACNSGVTQEEYQRLQNENEQLSSRLEEAIKKLEATPEPTSTPIPTPTPTPTPMPTPTPTPEPTPTPKPKMSEEEYKASCIVGYDYKTLARDPDTYIGTHAMFRGKVIQVMESSYGITTLRVNVTQGKYTWENTIYVTYIPGPGEKRILEDDIVVMYGEMQDLKTYETVLGSTVTIPWLSAEYIDIE